MAALLKRVIAALLTAVALLIVVPAPAGNADIEPFPTGSYSTSLNTRIAAFNSAVSSLNSRAAALKSQIDANQSAIAAHNAKVDSYPGRAAPPAIAAQLNAEAAQLNAERDRLNAQVDALKAEAGRLETERAAIQAAVKLEHNAKTKANPPPHQAPQPGNQYQQQPQQQQMQKLPPKPQSQSGGNPTHNPKPNAPQPKPPELRPATVKGPNGEQLPGVPVGAPSTLANSGKGYRYPMPPTPGIDPRVVEIRVMNPTTTPGGYSYPNGYCNYSNANGQVVNPITGQTIGKSDPYWHIPL